MPNGLRLTFPGGDGVYTHESACQKVGSTIHDIMKAGIVRVSEGSGIAVGAPLNNKQADMIIGDWRQIGPRMFICDVWKNNGRIDYKEFERIPSAEGLETIYRRTVRMKRFHQFLTEQMAVMPVPNMLKGLLPCGGRVLVRPLSHKIVLQWLHKVRPL